ncbi:MAG TPA: PQQ-binding-like beta-propeller repeat protein [Myxococcaceae bacterium]|nr:PQQ-binding-like beta-propeller repeat protein [Myxococcaceae bacterium]
MRRGPLLAVALAALGGCVSGRAPVLADPFSRELSAPLAVFSVDYWHAMLETSTTMEFVPREFATPAVDPASGRVVVGTRDGVLRSVTIDGKVRWAIPTPAPFFAGVLIRDGVVYAPGGDGVLRALKADTGALLWTYDCGEELVTVPVLAEGRVLVASQSATLYAVSVADGKWVWQYRRTPPAGFILRGASTPVVREGIVYLGFSDGHAAALDAKTGGAIWDRVLSTGTQFIDVSSTPGFDPSGHLIVASYKDGLFALDPKTGDTVWQSTASGLAYLVVRGSVVFAAGEDRVGAWSTETGRSIWITQLPDRAGQQPAFASGLLLLPTGRALLFIDRVSGRILRRFDPGKGVTATPGVYGPDALVLSNLGFVYGLHVTQPGAL